MKIGNGNPEYLYSINPKPPSTKPFKIFYKINHYKVFQKLFGCENTLKTISSLIRIFKRGLQNNILNYGNISKTT